MAIKETVEREVKLRAGDAFRLPELGGEAIEPRVFVSTYHDTADHRLGPSRDHAAPPGRERQGPVAAQAAARERAARARGAGGADGAAGSAELELLAGHLRGVPLLPIARLRTRREGVRADGAEVVHDTVAVLDHQRVTRSFEELEVELLDGDEKTLRRLEKALRRAGAADGETRPKVFQALDLEFRGRAGRRAADDTSASADAARPPPRAGRASCSRTIPARGSAPTSEELHQLRVATRRLRAFLRAGGDLLDPEVAEPLRAELQLAGERARPCARPRRADRAPGGRGRVRSAATRRKGRKLVRTLERSRRIGAAARCSPRSTAHRYFALLDALEHPFATDRRRALAGRDPRRGAPAAEEGRRTRSTSDSAGRGAARRPDQSQACALRGRARGRQPYVTAAKRLQDVLGEHQDAVVAIEQLREPRRRGCPMRPSRPGG